MLGSGAVIVMDETTCMVRAAERVVRFFSHESCGQCTPCREGTTWLEMILRRIEEGQGRSGRPRPGDWVSPTGSASISAWPPKMTTICPLGPSAVSPIKALKDYFRGRSPGTCRLRGVSAVSEPVTINVDGREFEVKPGELVIKAAEDKAPTSPGSAGIGG
jgi:NADH-quinone oxidoreductase subunit F